MLCMYLLPFLFNLLIKKILTYKHVSAIIIIVNKRITDAIRSELLQIKMIYLDRYTLVCGSFFLYKGDSSDDIS